VFYKKIVHENQHKSIAVHGFLSISILSLDHLILNAYLDKLQNILTLQKAHFLRFFFFSWNNEKS